MPATTKSIRGTGIKAKAKQLLAFAQDQVNQGRSGEELFMVIFGSRGKARMLFPTKAEWLALERSDEIESVRKLIESVQNSHIQDNGELSVTLRLPKSVHAALMAEAAAEGVTLDRLCLSKLVAQLRELV